MSLSLVLHCPPRSDLVSRKSSCSDERSVGSCSAPTIKLGPDRAKGKLVPPRMPDYDASDSPGTTINAEFSRKRGQGRGDEDFGPSAQSAARMGCGVVCHENPAHLCTRRGTALPRIPFLCRSTVGPGEYIHETSTFGTRSCSFGASDRETYYKQWIGVEPPRVGIPEEWRRKHCGRDHGASLIYLFFIFFCD